MEGNNCEAFDSDGWVAKILNNGALRNMTRQHEGFQISRVHANTRLVYFLERVVDKTKCLWFK